MANKIANVKFYKNGTTITSKVYKYAISSDEQTRLKLRPHNKYFSPRMISGSHIFYNEMKIVSITTIPGPYPPEVTSVIKLVDVNKRVIETYRR